jgi:hypothetical protein
MPDEQFEEGDAVPAEGFLLRVPPLVKTAALLAPRGRSSTSSIPSELFSRSPIQPALIPDSSVWYSEIASPQRARVTRFPENSHTHAQIR